MSEPEFQPCFTIPLPGGRIARIPAAVVEEHAMSEGRCVHADAGDDDVAVVSAHHFSVDANTGSHDFHTDWELGECEFVDEAGFPQRKHAWHRHPFGTEYAELYEGR
ncbi:MAG: hypothetical protein FJ096_08905 [Deltaproteobacteria bacterium]|nr:hypothetical protein [Deltaproteobacteria bacterium]